jgi:hypothetical protein
LYKHRRSKEKNKMNERIKKNIIRLAMTLLLLSMSACGVKGDPVPPATPAEIGLGRPVYQLPKDSKPTSIVPNAADDEEEVKKEE